MLGGKRQGAGRKKGSSTLEALAYRELLLKRVEEEKLPLINALITKGKSGDVQALKEINERTMGKMPQTLSGDKENPIEHRIIYLPQREPMETTSGKTDGSSADNPPAGV